MKNLIVHETFQNESYDLFDFFLNRVWKMTSIRLIKIENQACSWALGWTILINRMMDLPATGPNEKTKKNQVLLEATFSLQDDTGMIGNEHKMVGWCWDGAMTRGWWGWCKDGWIWLWQDLNFFCLRMNRSWWKDGRPVRDKLPLH